MVAVGDPAIMKCSTTGIPSPLVTWYKGDIEVRILHYRHKDKIYLLTMLVQVAKKAKIA
jgi:hypothetical protein